MTTDQTDQTDQTKTPIAFVGLGVMGYPMAGHLLDAGHPVTVYNRTTQVAERFSKEHGAPHQPTPGEAAALANIVFLCVGNDDDLRQVTLDAGGVVSTMSDGSILVDHTTASAEIARELDAACKARGIGFLDAPISGGQSGAENGQLTIMCGGEEATYERAKPVMDCYAKQTRLLGPAGSGQLTKMVNQICIAGMVQALSEGIAFARRAGLDPIEVVGAISKGAAQSWQMDNRHKTMTEGKFDYGFAVEWMRKDLGIALDEARRNGSHLPVTALVNQFYSQVEAKGGSRWDTSSLITLLDPAD